MDDGGSLEPVVLGGDGNTESGSEAYRHFKIRKMPMFFACLALISFLATFGLSFFAATSRSSLLWAPFVSIGVFFVSLVSLRVLTFRRNLSRRVSSRHRAQEAAERLLDAPVTEENPSQSVFDAEDIIPSSPFTIEQLREVALSVAAEAHDITEDSSEWTPIDLPKPLYAEAPKARPYKVEVLERANYRSGTTIKEAAAKIAETGPGKVFPSRQEKAKSMESDGALSGGKLSEEEPISNLDDVLERRRAF